MPNPHNDIDNEILLDAGDVDLIICDLCPDPIEGEGFTTGTGLTLCIGCAEDYMSEAYEKYVDMD